MTKLFSALTGTSRFSTSKYLSDNNRQRFLPIKVDWEATLVLKRAQERLSPYLANFSNATWALDPKTMLGWK